VAEEFPQINSISDLNKALREPEHETAWWPWTPSLPTVPTARLGMVKLYDMDLTRRNIRQMDAGLVYTALKNGQVFAGLVYTTDGRLSAFNLKLLER
jgi:osmoprotectant transport system substrate-binding protein